MGKKLDQAVQYLRRASIGSYSMAMILSVMADLAIRMAVPGSGLLEVLLSLLVAAIVFATVIIKNKKNEGAIMDVHTAFAA